MDQPHYLDSLAIRSRTAIVMPQWFPPEITADAVVDVLTTNLADVDAYAAPANVCLVVDACPAAETAVAAVNQDRTSAGLEPFVVAINGENLGQGGSSPATPTEITSSTTCRTWRASPPRSLRPPPRPATWSLVAVSTSAAP
jgi:hypothetical protein